jgi:hypothetical protein
VAAQRPDIEAILGHPVSLVVPPDADHSSWIAVSVVGEPPRVRAAWVRPDGEVAARLGCPPGIPSPVRPAVASIVDVDADGVADRVVLGRVAPGLDAVRVLIADPEVLRIDVGADDIIAARLPRGIAVVAIDPLNSSGEAVGRLERTGMADLRSVAGRLEGHLGASHGMAAGFGAGDTVADLATAELEAGYSARLPTAVPDSLTFATVRVEPEAAYPFAPPSIAIAWSGADDARILIRQCPGPLAVPELPDARGRAVDIAGAPGVLRGRGRGIAFVVWEQGGRAFGLQARGLDDIDDVALAVARSIPHLA